MSEEVGEAQLSTEEAAAYLGVQARQFRKRYVRLLQSTPGPAGVKYYRRGDLDAVRTARPKFPHDGGEQDRGRGADQDRGRAQDRGTDQDMIRSVLAPLVQELQALRQDASSARDKIAQLAERAALAEWERDQALSEAARLRDADRPAAPRPRRAWWPWGRS